MPQDNLLERQDVFTMPKGHVSSPQHIVHTGDMKACVPISITSSLTVHAADSSRKLDMCISDQRFRGRNIFKNFCQQPQRLRSALRLNSDSLCQRLRSIAV